MTDTVIRTCPRCGQTKPAADFYVSKHTGYGLTPYCRECLKALAIATRAAMTPEERRAKDLRDQELRKLRPNTKEQQRKHSQRNREKNGNPPNGDRELRNEYMREWRAGNLERAREIGRKGNREYKRRDPERFRMQCAVTQANSRARKLGRPGKLTYEIWLERLALYENACAFCGATSCHLDLEHLESLANGGSNEPENVVPACRPCNAQKWRRPLAEFCALRGLDMAAVVARAASCARPADR